MTAGASHPQSHAARSRLLVHPASARRQRRVGDLGKEARRQPPTRLECSIDPSVISLLADYLRGPSYASTRLALQRPRAWPGPVTCTLQGRCAASLLTACLLPRYGLFSCVLQSLSPSARGAHTTVSPPPSRGRGARTSQAQPPTARGPKRGAEVDPFSQ